WEATWTLTLMAAVRTTRAVIGDMVAAGRGAIVTTSSVNAFLPDPAVIDYGAAKAALSNFCKALSKEVGPSGVRVNTVSPGPVATALWLGAGGGAETVARPAGAAANTGHVVSYGADPVTARLDELVREHFGADAVGFPVFNGTAANVVGLRAMLRPWQGVICAESAHLNVDEGGAPEAMAGIKLLTVPTPDGKLATELVERRMTRIGDEHVVQPGVVSITQSTELGTLYTVEEMAEL